MGKKILIVEDHADVRKLIRMTLEMGDYEVREVGHAIDALVAVGQRRPDLVLLDVRIRGPFDGLELCRHWRSDPDLAAMRIVMLSAQNASEDLEAGLRAGAHAYMLKPFSPMELLEVVQAQTEPIEAGTGA